MTRVRLPDTPTLQEVAREIMRANFKLRPENALTEWRIEGERYARVVAEMKAFRGALCQPVLVSETHGLLVCGVPLFPEEIPS